MNLRALWEKIQTPMSWQAYNVLYFFVSSFITMIWPVIWCTKSLATIGGLHVLVEGMGVSRLLFNQSRLVQPFWIFLSVVYIVLSFVLSYQAALDMFQISFVVTDAGSLWVGLVVALSASSGNSHGDGPGAIHHKSVQQLVGFFFFVHGLAASFLPPILDVGFVLESDQLSHFFLIFFSGLPQSIVTLPLYEQYATTRGSFIVHTKKMQLKLVVLWAFMVGLCFLVINLFVQKSTLPCGTHSITNVLAGVFFPLIGFSGLMLSFYFYKKFSDLEPLLPLTTPAAATAVLVTQNSPPPVRPPPTSTSTTIRPLHTAIVRNFIPTKGSAKNIDTTSVADVKLELKMPK